MADPQRVDIPGVGLVEFPDSMSAEDVNVAAKKLYDGANPSAKAPNATKESDSGAVGLAAAQGTAPVALNALERFGTSPTLPKTFGTLGRLTGAIAAPIVGGYEGGGLGAVGGGLGASSASWAGGKTGYFTGKMLQDAALPMSKGLRRIAPYANAISRFGQAAQGPLDLAQMAEPTRKDIGFLGVGPSTPHDPEHPALLNAAAARLRDFVLSHLGQQ